MKRVDKIAHRKIVSSLVQMEQYFALDEHHSNDADNARKMIADLEEAFNVYQQYLRELEWQISAYDELYQQARIKFVGYKLKELKRNLTKEEFKNFQDSFGYSL
ncbi:hypothetical protein [Mucilaginibacter auburnensis]|uniref:Uncharacterized protein n=1 Tax=Mucilaginibacter auburnensis TaxID=1457233 RepID=A0A2H9VNU7_9SPHI|nr:hypothetical protein [Mucilaginibacter auburnensis]PJJ79992.1 hypothetical protein CLV57_3134 [Mucilaginibacter auburnensis]